jgi:hypothetical protein
MTGGIAIAVGVGLLLWKRRGRAAVLFTAAAAIPVMPWLVRNAVETGNPLAPFFNAWFPNPYFHIATERQLVEALRSYGIAFLDRFPEVLWGWRVQGVVGPAFLLAPIALLNPIAVAMTIPWWLNAGARFLMPALLRDDEAAASQRNRCLGCCAGSGCVAARNAVLHAEGMAYHRLVASRHVGLPGRKDGGKTHHTQRPHL